MIVYPLLATNHRTSLIPLVTPSAKSSSPTAAGYRSADAGVASALAGRWRPSEHRTYCSSQLKTSRDSEDDSQTASTLRRWSVKNIGGQRPGRRLCVDLLAANTGPTSTLAGPPCLGSEWMTSSWNDCFSDRQYRRAATHDLLRCGTLDCHVALTGCSFRDRLANSGS